MRIVGPAAMRRSRLLETLSTRIAFRIPSPFLRNGDCYSDRRRNGSPDELFSPFENARGEPKIDFSDRGIRISDEDDWHGTRSRATLAVQVFESIRALYPESGD